MKLSLSCIAVLLVVVTVSSHHVPGHHRPSQFGEKYVVYGDTKRTTCIGRGKCSSRWYQTQYYQNLNKRTQLRINTNKRKVHDNIFYQRSVFGGRFNKYLLDVSTNKCRVSSVRTVPFLHVPASFSNHGIAYVEGKACEIWQRVTGGRGRPVIFRTWYVYWNKVAHRYEPVRYAFRITVSRLSRRSLAEVTNWRGYSSAVSDSVLKIPSQC